MMWFKRFVAAAALLIAAAYPVFAQTQFPAGTVWGNATATARPGKAETVTAILDRAFGSTRGSVLRRGASGWEVVTPGTLGFPFVSAGAGADPLYQLLGLVGGGTNADLSATGGTSQFLRQNSAGAAITVVRPACADLSNAAASCSTDATNASNIGSGSLNILRFPSIAANTMIANWTAAGAVPIANTIPACANDGSHALVYINGTGLQCATIIAGSGNVSNSGTPTANQTGVWVTSTTIKGVGPGTLGQHLVSNGSGSDPSYKSGGWTLLNTLTASGSVDLQDTTSFTSSYSEYQISWENIVPASTSNSCLLQVHSGGSFQAASYFAGAIRSTTTTVASSGQTTNIPCDAGSLNLLNAVPGVSGHVNVSSPSSTSSAKNWHGTYSMAITGGTLIGTIGGFWNSTAALTGFKIVMNSGNITSGVVRVYGRL